jgi:hypothetical protein
VVYLARKQHHYIMKTIAQQLNIKTFPFVIKDDRGNTIYFEHAKGRWEKQEFDNNDNLLYYENNNGYWGKHEYDEKGNKIYLETNINGIVIDRRPNKELRDALAVLEKAGLIVDGKIIKI